MGALVWAPAAIWLVVSGSLVKGIVLALVGLLILGNVDNVMRPLLLSGSARMNTLVLIISLLGGVSAFGFIGIVLGPVVAAVFTALVESYQLQPEEEQRRRGPAPTPPPPCRRKLRHDLDILTRHVWTGEMSKVSLAILTISSLSAAVLVAALPQATPPATKPAAPATKPAEAAPPATAKAAPAAAAAKPATATAPAPKTTDGIWPREVVTSIGIATIYVPQVEARDGVTLEFRAAVRCGEVRRAARVRILWGKARTSVDKDARVVSPLDREFTKLVIPSAQDKQETWSRCRARKCSGGEDDRPRPPGGVLEVAAADKMAASVPVKNDPPKIVFSKQIAILAYVDGKPVYQPVKDTKLERVINTRVLLLKDKGEHFIKVFDGWLEAKALDASEWEVVKKADKDLEKALADAKASGQVDFLPGGNPNDAKTLPTLKSGKVPRIVVATSPTELIVTRVSLNLPRSPRPSSSTSRTRPATCSATRATRSSTCSSRAASSGRRPSTGRGSTWPPTPCRRTSRRSPTTARRRT